MKANKILLLVTLLVVLVGAVTASEISDETSSIDTSDLDDTLVQDTTPATATVEETVTTETKESKKVVKEEKNTKTASKTYDVSDFDTLHNALTSDIYNTVTVNIKSDIELADNTELNSAIKTLTINGNGKTIDGNEEYQFLDINENTKATLKNIKITRCYGKDFLEIAIKNYGTLTIYNSTLNNNYANNYGGAIYNEGNLTINYSNLNYNLASRSGAAISNMGTLTIINSDLNYNTAHDGGAIYNEGILNISQSNLNYNNAVDGGGAIENQGTLNISQSNLNYNNAVEGGAIHNWGELNISQSNLNYNNAEWDGGAIYNDGILTITNSNLINNTASKGGAISNENNTNGWGSLIVTNSRLNNNYANNYGGAIYNYAENITIKNNIFSNNNALNGSAIFTDGKLHNEGIWVFGIWYETNNYYGGNNKIINNTFKCNKAKETGLAIIDNGLNTIIKNNAKDNISIYSSTINIVHGTNNSIINNIFDDVNYPILIITTNNTNPTINDKINLSFTLKDQNNSPLSNVKITITINGKKYSLTTNTKGIATQTYTPTTNTTQKITATYDGNETYNKTTSTLNITVNKINTKLTLKVSNTTPINNTSINITTTLTDENNKKLSNQNITINISGKIYTIKTNNNGVATLNYTPTHVETQTITATYNGDSQYNNSTVMTQITVKNKINTKTTVQTNSGIIGEKLTLKATVTDTNNKKVNEGNLIFKLNGVTIKDNGKLSGSSNPLKVKVTNGIASATIIPDLEMRNADKLTAHYIGMDNYNASASSAAKIQISQRNASIVVSSNVKIIKQGQVLTITAKVYDTTNGKKSTNLTKYADEFVYFKVNGITLKDSKGQMLKVKIVNGTATAKYTIPLGLSGVTDGKTMTPKNHTILAGFYNKNYQENIRNTSYFQVERSNITITIANATVNNKTHKLSLTATIKDYLGNIVKGPNKCVIKINGVSLKNGTQPMYYYSTDGILNIKNITIPTYNKYTSIEIVTQDRLAYKSQRNTTTVIKVLNK